MDNMERPAPHTAEGILSDVQPTTLILLGNDEHAIKDYLQTLINQLGDPAMAELNLARLDGAQASLEDLSNATGAIPFLAARRLVIFTRPLERIKDQQAQERFKALLNNLPETTLLVLVIEDQPKYQKGSLQWSLLNPKHWLMQWVEQAAGRVKIVTCELPPPYKMPEWIQNRAREMSGQFTRGAAEALASHVGNDTRTAALEIEKLLTYVDFKRPVEPEDVEQLTASQGQANIFDMTDALAQGNLPTAQRLLHRLLEEEDALRVFGMIVRQFRLLLLTREILDEGGNQQMVQNELGLSQYPAQKAITQAQRFTIAQLETIYRRLLALDEAVKTGQMPIELALETFVVEKRG